MVLPAGSVNQIWTVVPCAPRTIGDALTFELGDGFLQVADSEAHVGTGRSDGPGSGRCVHQMELGRPDSEPVAVDSGNFRAGIVGQAQQTPVELDRGGQLALDVEAVVQGAGDSHGCPSG